MLRSDLAAPRHPGDGAGRAWIEPPPEPLAAGTAGSWRLHFEASALGIDEGGWLFFQVSPFWGWDTPQVFDPQRPGYCEVSTTQAGLELDPQTIDAGLLGIEIGAGKLQAGSRISIEYGAGPFGARSDRYAERESPFYFAVDADGDGVRGLLEDQPRVDVLPGPPAQVRLVVESTPPSDRFWANVAVLDALGNGGVAAAGAFLLERHQPGASFSNPVATVVLESDDVGTRRVELARPSEWVNRYRIIGPAGRTSISNPLVRDDGPRILWADLHGHSQFSDGTGTPEDYFGYARDVAALDVAALTDHDHWGMEPLSEHPDLWDRIQDATERFHAPRSFVTVLGYEWTSWIHGHRHVLYFEGEGEVYSSIDPAYESPSLLWEALRGRPALTFAHHSAGGPIATDWSIAPDPELEPVTEIVSVHGSSEAADSPLPIYSPVRGNWVRDSLDYGYRLGFVGSGDTHDGHPGLAHLAGGSGGLAAILSEELTREAVLEALRSRRVYATNGPRIVVRANLDGAAMGARVAPSRRSRLSFSIAAEGPIERVDLVRSGEVEALPLPGVPGAWQLRSEHTLRALKAGEYVYLRVVQQDGGAAWSSPFFVDED